MEKKMKPVKAWWFEPAGGKLGYDDGRRPRKGITHKVKCAPVLCNAGLHASIKLLDALQYASSNVVWRVELSGELVRGDDKICATERTYIQRIDCESILFEASRKFALDVIHLWNAPDVVVQFLKTGDESLRDTAWAAAAGAAAWAAAAGAAAWAAARAAAWGEERDTAWAAARPKQNAYLTRKVLAAMRRNKHD